jgi:MinD-like ATPase involved in chromosome partitioning or flagellar assembly
MKIKLAILEKDQNYLNRFVSSFSTKYSDKFEIYSFTNQDVALSTLESSKIDIFMANDAFDVDVRQLPKRCGFAYLVDSIDVESLNNQRAIGKFQRVDLIYKQILSIYSEKAGSMSGLKMGDDTARVVAFQSISGGCGGSTMAAACALHYAALGKKTLYLNLEKFGSSDVFFSAEGQFSMSDIIYALKSKNVNLALKLESSVKMDPRGVYFFSAPAFALDMMELKTDELVRLVSELRLTGSYDVIVLDLDFSINKEELQILDQAQVVVWVGDGSEISNTKLYRAYGAVSIMDQQGDSSLLGRLALVYNKFSNKTSRSMDDLGIRMIGGSQRYEHATTAMVLEQLVRKDVFDKIFA